MLEDHHSFHHGLRFTCCHCNEAIICQSMNLWCSSMLSATIQTVESCIMKHYPSDAWQIQRKSKKNCQSSYCTLSAIKTDSHRSQMYGNSKHSKCPRPPLSFSENFLFVDTEGWLELVEHTVVDVDLVLVSKNMVSLLAWSVEEPWRANKTLDSWSVCCQGSRNGTDAADAFVRIA